MQAQFATSFKKNVITVISLLCMLLSATHCQSDSLRLVKNYFDKLYGLDPMLYNGLRYIPDYHNASGFPFLLKNEPFNGELILSGKNYKNLQLQYNCFKQEFVLNYVDQNNANSAVILINNLIDTVKLDRKIFVPCKITGIQEAFMQLIYSGRVSCFITWKKEYNYIGSGPHTGFEYSKDIKKIYVSILNGAPVRINNKHSFLSLYEKPLKGIIKNYIADHTIRFKKITDEELVLLMQFCNSQPIQ